MVVFLLIVCSVPAIGLAWLWWADHRLRRMKVARWQRIALAAMVIANVLAFAGLILSRVFRWNFEVPTLLLVSTFVWHVVVLPITLMLTTLLLTGEAGLWLRRKLGSKSLPSQADLSQTQPSPAQHAAQPAQALALPTASLSRRQVLAAGVVGAPVLLQAAAVGAGLSQLDAFRIRTLVVRLPQLPIDFDGFTIAHVTDTHVGRFTNGATLDAIVAAVNQLKPDCVVHTGDLINDALSDMPAATAMLAKFRSTHGTFIVEGNHDLFESRTRFAELLQTPELQAAGLRLLLDDGATIDRGSGKLQLLGLQWGNTSTDDIRTDRARGPMLTEHADTVQSKLDPRAFAVLLAHHPHAFDEAQRLNIPLTIAGHTHGGQLNIAEGLGPATINYKYITGLYQKLSAVGEQCACIVGNGTGNWFPLRVNAPAEIIRIELRRA